MQISEKDIQSVNPIRKVMITNFNIVKKNPDRMLCVKQVLSMFNFCLVIRFSK